MNITFNMVDSHDFTEGAVDVFPLFDLPRELRLVVFENVTAELRRRLPIYNAELYSRDLDLALPQANSTVLLEAEPTLRQWRGALSPCLVLRLGRSPGEESLAPGTGMDSLYHLL
jgi:hypothetical protein